MKNILIVRHAKSSWANPGLEDRERPLNSRGKRDAPYMAAYCREQGLLPDQIISSPAIRAYTTAECFYAEFGNETDGIVRETDLYFGSENDWMYLINELSETCSFPFFFSHNPTITYFVNAFGAKNIENVPTCGVVHLISMAEKWQDVDYKNTRMHNYYFPKLVRE